MEKKKIIRYDTDVMAKNIWLSLKRDFEDSQGAGFAEKSAHALANGIPEFRLYKFPELGNIPPARYKRWIQLRDLFKKYQFENDLYSEQELEDLTIKKFFDDQLSFATYGEVTPLLHTVLQRARREAKRILGKYNPDATVMHFRFGKKSSIGCPLRLAYLDEKLSNAEAFTGSTECAKWFFGELLPGDPLLTEIVESMGFTISAPTLAHESLYLVNVPKSWKTYRPITPLTLLGLAYSYGVGEQITLSLKNEGLDISRLQEKHRRIVKEISRTLKYATADLSGASNSLLSWLLNRCLPREWYVAIKKTFSHQLVVRNDDGTERAFYCESVLPMGNGLTFPAETLVFYVLLKAIRDLSRVRGFISVYGDDLIYPSKLHRYVARIFPQLGMRLNLDKTFVQEAFRESCGSDFYHGIDVRPFFLPDKHQMLTRRKYEAWLYKCINGLRRRWSDIEVYYTLRLLLFELATVAQNGDALRVPPSFPDHAGIKVDNLSERIADFGISYSPVKVIFADGSRWFEFAYLSEKQDKRVVKEVRPYYWLALQGAEDCVYSDNEDHGIYRRVVPAVVLPPTVTYFCTNNRAIRKSQQYLLPLCSFNRACIHPKLWHLYPECYEGYRSTLTWKTTKYVRMRTIGSRERKIVVEKQIAYSSSRTGIRTVLARTPGLAREPGSISDWI